MKYFLSKGGRTHSRSRPARGAWVEIVCKVALSAKGIVVAPREGRVG